MTGWLITLYRLADEASIRRSFADPGFRPEWRAECDDGAIGERVAVWQAAAEGLAWIEEAARCDGGISRLRLGYPNWYLVRAADVLPVIRNRRPRKAPMHENPHWITGAGDVIMPGWLGQTTIDEGIDRCGPTEWLLVEAWDES